MTEGQENNKYALKKWSENVKIDIVKQIKKWDQEIKTSEGTTPYKFNNSDEN